MNTTREFLDRQYGQTTGTAWIGHKNGNIFTPTKFDWPAQADEMVRTIGMADYEGDVWYTAHLLSDTKSRSKGSSVERTKIHADIDRALTSEDRQKIAQLEAWTVLSGSAGHVHVYVELDRSVSLDEYERLEAALVFFLDADRSKVCDNDLLRIPGTNNHKPEPKGGPVLNDRPYEKARAWSPELLATILPVAQVIQQKVEILTSGDIQPVRVPVLPNGVAASLERLTGDRSRDIYAVICEAAKAGLTIGQALGIVLAEPALASRYKEKGQAFMLKDMHNTWAKATAKADAMRDDNDFSDLLGPNWKPESPNTTDDLPEAFKAPTEGFKMRTVSQMAKPRRMEWLAHGRIPKSATTILVGNEGIGKSLFWVHLVAIVTNGWAAPHLGIAATEPQHVVLVLNEDDFTTTVVPRLIAAGVNLDYVHVISADDEGRISPTFPDINAMEEIRSFVEGNDVALVVIDTWMNSLNAKVDLRNAVAARSALHPWNDLAQTCRTSVLLVTHTNRLDTKDARSKMGGTSELRKAARSTLFAQLDEEKRLTIGVDKSNVAGVSKASAFQLAVTPVAYEDGTEEDMAYLRYVGDCDKTAAEILESVADIDNDEAQEKKSCEAWLQDYLQGNGGSVLSNELNSASNAQGYSQRTLMTARRKLGVKAVKNPDGKWAATL